MQVGSGQLHELQRKTKDLGIFAADPQVKVLFVPQLQQHARAYFDGYINQDVLQFGVEQVLAIHAVVFQADLMGQLGIDKENLAVCGAQQNSSHTLEREH